jgi:hypothetical protein
MFSNIQMNTYSGNAAASPSAPPDVRVGFRPT